MGKKEIGGKDRDAAVADSSYVYTPAAIVRLARAKLYATPAV